jgi:hypothetical protein
VPDADDHALFARLAVGILVLTEVLFGHRVDVLVRALSCDLRNAPADLHVLVWVLHVLHLDRDARVALQVARPGAPLGRVDDRVTILHVHPCRRHLHRAVGTQGRDMCEVLVPEQLLGATFDLCAHLMAAFLAIVGVFRLNDRAAPERV